MHYPTNDEINYVKCVNDFYAAIFTSKTCTYIIHRYVFGCLSS